MTYERDRETAIQLLQHYLRLAVTAAGKPWTADNDAEVRELVEALVRSAVRQVLAREEVPDPDERAR